MRIRISDLPLEGLHISENIALEPLNARLHEGEGCDIRFTTPPAVKITVTRTPDGAETRGTVTAKYLQPCGRCSDDLERDITVEFNYILKPIPAHALGKQLPEYEDDLGILFFEGEHIELEGPIQESLIVQLSQYWSPPVDAEGKCSVCGKRAALEAASVGGKASLGDLFKKAGLK
ncbi:MAG: DUF177 domain-containing protein [Proteobacteria bacterium]|nr:DUF177 domain-containing protein [Pseudomonadota bacterium]